MIEKNYQPADIEGRMSRIWEDAGAFRAGRPERRDAKPFTIVIPPPNVTGSLHMGHALNNTLQDILCRFERMRGRDVLWQPGTDHAGIATQMVVERQLTERQEPGRREMGRAKFLERVWQWKAESGGVIVNQLKRLGASCDWSRERFTMDEGLSRAVVKVFVELHRDGLIYKDKRLVNWDTKLLTAISDLEVQQTEVKGSLWYLRYPIQGKTFNPDDPATFIVSATTRPETMLGDTAVAVHPDDERYANLVGKNVILALVGRKIPIVADEYSDPEKGSGAVKVMPAHDFNDFEVGKRHNLPQISVLDQEGALALSGNEDYLRGLPEGSTQLAEELHAVDRFSARKQILARLEDFGFLDRVEPNTHMVPHGDRSGVIIEPYLTDQWYVDAKTLAEPAIAAVRSGATTFVPKNWEKTYFEWMENIQPWCISRQLWWGHQIPAWYGPDGKVFVAETEEEAGSRALAYHTENGAVSDAQARNMATHSDKRAPFLTRDEDVLDTWFSSALWPFSTLGWPDATAELGRFYPGSVLVTGFDIIFFWVARMMMMGLKFMGEVPFRDVYITGLILDEHGEKMSKSKGNVIDPLDIVDGIPLEALVAKRTAGLMQPQLAPAIERATRKQYPAGIAPHGTDALRFTFAALASPSRDIRFALARVACYRNFCNKLWNAARFVTMAVGETAAAAGGETRELSIADRWICSRFGRLLGTLESAFRDYRFDYAASALYEFTWYDFCDWYLELTKPVLQGEGIGAAARRGTQRTLVQVLESLQRALHPLMPFITEEIWQRVAPLAARAGESVMLQAYPAASDFAADEEAEREVAWIQAAVLGVRQIRGEMNINPARRIAVLFKDASAQDQAFTARHRAWLERLAGLASITVLPPGAAAPQSAAALVGTLTILVPMARLIDASAEAERLGGLLAKAQDDLAKAHARLANESFVRNAPTAVVTTERERAAELERTASALSSQLERVRGLLAP